MGEKQIKNRVEPVRSAYSSNIIKFVKTEINTPQNKALLCLVLVASAGVFGYTTYVRHKFERLGYYMAIQEDGRVEFLKKKSNWET